MNEDAYFDKPDALIAADGFVAYRDATPAPKPRGRGSRAYLAAQQERLELLQRDGFTCRIGANGMTVFRGPDQWGAA